MQKTPSPLWKRNTAVFLASQAISLFGSALVQYAISWHVTLTTQSGLYMTISILCAFLPTLIVSPFAGVWADRYDRKRLIILSDAAIALTTLALAILYVMGYQALWLLFVAVAVRAVGGAVQTPAVNAMLPDIVPEAQLQRVNGINGAIQSLLQLASPALAGALLTATGRLELLFSIDVVTAALAILVLLRFLHLPRRTPALQETAGYLDEIRAGLGYIRRHGYLLHMFLYSVLIYLCFAPISFLTPLQVVRVYGDEVWRLTAIEIAFAGGMLVGGVVISAWRGLKNRIHTMGWAMVLVGLFTILLGIGMPFWPYAALMLLIGLMMPFFNTPAVTLLQEKVDAAYIGRVFSVLSMISGSMMPLGMLIFGPLADVMPIETMLILTGAVVALASLLIMKDKTVLAAGRQESADS